MKAVISSAVLAALLGLANAKVALTNSNFDDIEAGSTFQITWSGEEGPVTLTLKTGESDDLDTVSTITSNASGESFNWAVDPSLPSGDYAIEITDGTDINYSEMFPVEGSDAPVSSTGSASSTASATSTPASSTASSSATATSVTKTASTSSEATSSETMSAESTSSETTSSKATSSTKSSETTSSAASSTSSESSSTASHSTHTTVTRTSSSTPTSTESDAAETTVPNTGGAGTLAAPIGLLALVAALI
ncbi:Ser-Thr-rich glycosyl-phosphatidyl-inositol-anchored membrane family-domain-containing protein [Astrocystis sublimbata]|nr:Ser-Thr-rich glycosyl-phosphatidyl-inositol-anchored membrane family-domain-containing protein [Astrocystis sublimbata]